MKVQALVACFLDNVYRNPGDVFEAPQALPGVTTVHGVPAAPAPAAPVAPTTITVDGKPAKPRTARAARGKGPDLAEFLQ